MEVDQNRFPGAGFIMPHHDSVLKPTSFRNKMTIHLPSSLPTQGATFIIIRNFSTTSLRGTHKVKYPTVGGWGVRGWGSPNSDDWRKCLALFLLCGGTYGLDIFLNYPAGLRSLGSPVRILPTTVYLLRGEWEAVVCIYISRGLGGTHQGWVSHLRPPPAHAPPLPHWLTHWLLLLLLFRVYQLTSSGRQAQPCNTCTVQYTHREKFLSSVKISTIEGDGVRAYLWPYN